MKLISIITPQQKYIVVSSYIQYVNEDHSIIEKRSLIELILCEVSNVGGLESIVVVDIYKQNLSISLKDSDIRKNLEGIHYPFFDFIDTSSYLDREKRYPVISFCSSVAHAFMTMFVSDSQLYLCTQKKTFDADVENQIVAVQKRNGWNYLLFFEFDMIVMINSADNSVVV